MNTIRGILYINIVEAKRFEAKDPCVYLHIEGENVKMKTRFLRKSKSFIWNEEYLISILNKNVSIHLKIDDYIRYFRRRRSIGDIHFNVGELKNDIPNDSWYPLSGNDKKGEIRIISHFIPSYHVNGVEIIKIPNIRIHIEKESYFPGELLKGHLIYNDVQSNPSQMKEVQLKLKGSSKVNWTIPIVSSTGNSAVVYKSRYKSHHNFFNVVGNLIGKYNQNYHCYFIPFQYKLPYQLPPSFNHSYGKSLFKCKAKIGESFGFKNKISFPFIIKDNYELNIPYKEMNESKSSNNISIDIKYPNIAFLDENESIILSIKNDGKHPIKRASVKLKSIILFYGKHIFHTSKTSSRKLTSLKLNDKSSFPIDKGQSIKKNFVLHIPNKTPLTIFNHTCPNVQVTNHIIVKTITKGSFLRRKRKTKFSFPIIIGKRTDVNPEYTSTLQESVILTSEINNPYQYFAPIHQLKGSKKSVFVGKSVPNDIFFDNRIIPEQFEGKIKEVNYDKAKPIIDKSYKKKIRKYHHN